MIKDSDVHSCCFFFMHFSMTVNVNVIKVIQIAEILQDNMIVAAIK